MPHTPVTPRGDTAHTQRSTHTPHSTQVLQASSAAAQGQGQRAAESGAAPAGRARTPCLRCMGRTHTCGAKSAHTTKPEQSACKAVQVSSVTRKETGKRKKYTMLLRYVQPRCTTYTDTAGILPTHPLSYTELVQPTVFSLVNTPPHCALLLRAAGVVSFAPRAGREPMPWRSPRPSTRAPAAAGRTA